MDRPCTVAVRPDELVSGKVPCEWSLHESSQNKAFRRVLVFLQKKKKSPAFVKFNPQNHPLLCKKRWILETLPGP